MSDGWGPWIEHDGKSWPPAPLGTIVHRVFCQAPDGGIAKGCSEHVHPLTHFEKGSWIGSPGAVQVVRYRIRKPKALADLKRLIADLPEKVDA